MRVILVLLIALLAGVNAFREDDEQYMEYDAYDGEGEQGESGEDPHEYLAGQLYWAEDPELMDAAEHLIALGNKLIAVLNSGNAADYRAICSPNEVWHGDGMWNPEGYGENCDEIVSSLTKLFANAKTVKADPLAIVPNPRNNDVFILCYITINTDTILGVVRMLMGSDHQVEHTYFMSQATDGTARTMLKNPEPAITARKALPKISVAKYAGNEEEQHMIDMWVQVNQLWLSVAEDVANASAFSDGVDPSFKLYSADQVFEGGLSMGKDDFLEHMQKQHQDHEMQVIQTSAAYSPTHHLSMQHVQYFVMNRELHTIQVAPGMEVLVFDTNDKLTAVWTFRQPFTIQERMAYFK